MNVTSSQIDILAKLLDVTDLRHQVIARNVANVNTPGYHNMTVDFDQAFHRALTHGDQNQALLIQPKTIEAEGALVPRKDGNNVDIDIEMARLNQNTIRYQSYLQLLNRQIATMRAAITGK